MNILELMQPLKNIRETGKAVHDLKIGDVLKNYAESVPGVMVAAKGVQAAAAKSPMFLPKVLNPKFVPKGVSFANQLAGATKAAAKWWTAPLVKAGASAKGAVMASKAAPIFSKAALIAKAIPGWGWALAGAAAVTGLVLAKRARQRANKTQIIKGGMSRG